MQITMRELSFLLEGLDLKSVHPHQELRYEALI
jgi:hypothetical protein